MIEKQRQVRCLKQSGKSELVVSVCCCRLINRHHALQLLATYMRITYSSLCAVVIINRPAYISLQKGEERVKIKTKKI